MSLNIPLLKKICETPGAPGYETKIRNPRIKLKSSKRSKVLLMSYPLIILVIYWQLKGLKAKMPAR
jgi:hypothetical protein